MRHVQRVLLGICGVGGLVLASGCFDSRKPLGSPSGGAIDDRLTATWSCWSTDKPPQGKEAVTMDVAAFDVTQYIVGWRETKEDGTEEKPDFYRAYSTRLDGETLLNVKQLGTSRDGGRWNFLRYRIEPDGRLHAWIVSDDAVGAREDAGLAVIRKRVKDDRLYADFMTCTRKESRP